MSVSCCSARPCVYELWLHFWFVDGQYWSVDTMNSFHCISLCVSQAANSAKLVMDAVRHHAPRDNQNQSLLSSRHSFYLENDTDQAEESSLPALPIATSEQRVSSAAPGGGYVWPHYSALSDITSVNNGDLSGRNKESLPLDESKMGEAVLQRHPKGVRTFSTRTGSHGSSSRCGSIRGSTIVFRQISYVVTTRKMPWSKPVPVQVLSNVS